MADIFVTGHRNPDTDSIVAALAYANLRQALGDREYRAVRIGGINDETHRVLERFGVEPPEYVRNLRTQVKDIEFDRPPLISEHVTTELAWDTMTEQDVSTMPVTDDDGKLFGVITKGDIATYDMETIEKNRVDDIPVFNLMSVLEGRLVNEYNYIRETLSGTVVIGIENDDGMTVQPDRKSIVICGGHTPTVQTAVNAKAACIIICNSDIRAEWKEIGEETCVISTPLSARAAARRIYQATPCGRICQREGVECFRMDDYIDDVREHMLKTKYHNYPVLDSDGRVVGLISRRHLLRPKRKQVVLVDHNEVVQSVPGLDQVDILEIIDHHRLADIQTSQPVSMRNEPVGSTNTIIAAIYQERGVMPSPAIAGLMAAAILSDTVMFKSPTCTKKDIAMAERLCRIAKVTVEELGKTLFSAQNDEGKTAEELFSADYKQFIIAEQNIGISQITCDNSEWFGPRRGEFFAHMEKIRKDYRLDMVILMITDVLSEGTTLYYVGDDEIISQAFNAVPKDKSVFLPGVMSRKKQIVPMFTAIWG